jgi:hypothetical protein
MSVDIATVVGSISWVQSKTNTGFVKTKQGPDQLSITQTPSTSTYNRIYAASGTLAASGTTTIDLQGVTDYLGQSLTLTKIIALQFTATGSNFSYEPGASNGLTWFLSGTSPVVTVKDGGFFLIGDGTYGTVSGSAKTIKITNVGATSGTYEIALIGGQ